jgi:hypothetical protein
MSSPTPSLFWVINADCERELERPLSYRPDARTEQALRQKRARFLALTCGEPWAFPTQLEVQGAPSVAPAQVLFWCPTPFALSCARSWGARDREGPSLEVLQRVNDKTFLTQRLGRWVHPDRQVIHFGGEWEQLRRERNGALRVRRRFGFAGRGARVIPERPSPDDARYVQDSLARGPLVVEPQLAATRQWSIHGAVRPGQFLCGEPCTALTDDRGAPLGVPQRALNCPHRRRLRELAEDASAELTRAGYFGPFGMDVLETPRELYAIDLNARFTLGWSVGLGNRRAEALELCLGPDGTPEEVPPQPSSLAQS